MLNGCGYCYGLRSELFLKMKLIAFILFASIFTVSASTYSQQVYFTMDMEKATVKAVLDKIEKESEFIFLYSEKSVDLNREVDVKVDSQNVEKILNILFDDTDNCYEIVDRQIAILKKKKDARKVFSKGIIQQKKDTRIKVAGVVTDAKSSPLPGASVVVEGSTRGVTTDFDGKYEIKVKPTDKLLFSFIGMVSQTIPVEGKTKIDVKLVDKSEELADVTIVAFGKQKKESVVSSITTVDVKSLQAMPTSNITTALAGQMTGLISYQSTGAPGDDNAQFFIRNAASFGNNVQEPLILIDNVEVDSRQISRLSPDDIASFSILKDAAATALYGARGGNGVVLITTKEGREGKTQVNVRVESSLSMPTNEVEIADPITYMQSYNEAVLTRDPTAAPRYSFQKIENTQNPNRNPYVYPANNWLDDLTRDYSINKRANVSLSGGGKVASYYVAASYSQDQGILEVDNNNPWDTNINYQKFTLRSNTNINVGPETKLNIRLSGSFDDYSGPIGEKGSGGKNTYNRAMNADPVGFAPVYRPDYSTQHVPYLLFGNSPAGNRVNPYAELMKGYEDNKASTLSAQVELHQKLNFITDGLKFKFITNISRYGQFSLERSYIPYYFSLSEDDYFPHLDAQTPEHDGYFLNAVNPDEGSRFIDYAGNSQKVTSTIYSEASFTYNKEFNDHTVGGLLVGSVRDFLSGAPKIDNLSQSLLNQSLPKRNISIAGRVTYGYKSKYFAEANFGLNGSERFAKGDRFGFFPSIGLGWGMHKEPFFENLGLNRIFSKLKLRGTYGMAGNDNLGGPNRFYYMSRVDLDGRRGGYWGSDPTVGLYQVPTVNVISPGNRDITWEITYKSNLAMEIGMFDGKLNIVPEVYRERRTNILQARTDIPYALGLPYNLYSNVQENVATGFECSADFKHSIGEDLWFILRGNFTYGTAEVTKIDQIGVDRAPWTSRLGHSPAQVFGFVAEHLFVDQNEVDNSADQSALGAEVMAGDIKYVDINGDGVINNYDRVPIGHPKSPEIQYGFGASFGYKNWDFSCFFQGQGRYSFWLNPGKIAPFLETRNNNEPRGGNRALLQWVQDNRWTEHNRDLHAQWPRFSLTSNVGNANNFQTSTYFMRTTSYLRLKQLEVGYSFKKLSFMDIRAYLSGSNLLVFSGFDMWDPEMAGNGLAYPLQKVFNFGLQINFK
ncbi:SusC/RagA family TonB-linked outer membrane protein [Prolixibacteraceae bacterium JC049]|nr:SusC/RagA family TonB-linked outer membrane protein [Prolixibacteraceae bacterium JC049]